jgi:hypothetical protein
MVVKQWAENGDPRPAINEVLMCLYVPLMNSPSEQGTDANFHRQIPPRIPRSKLGNPAGNDTVHGQLATKPRQQAVGGFEQTHQGLSAKPYEYTH